MTFDEAFAALMHHEGGFVDHAADPGGATRFGVTEAVARQAGYRGPMQDLPLDFAKRVARAAYWDAVRADELPPAVRYIVFDAAYHSGVGQSVRWLQRAVGTTADGIIGPQTLAAVRQRDPQALAAQLLGQRLEFMAGLPTWGHFGKGWARRVAGLLQGVA